VKGEGESGGAKGACSDDGGGGRSGGGGGDGARAANDADCARDCIQRVEREESWEGRVDRDAAEGLLVC